MTAVLLNAGAPSGSLAVPVVLARQEARRIVLHPIALLGFGLTTVLTLVVGDDGPRDAFEVPSVGPTFYYGVFVYFAAHLVASRDRRAHSGELLGATPAPATDRIAGLCLAALVPALLCAALVTVVHASQSIRDVYVVAPDVWHLAQGPLTVLGGALLGIMVAQLTRVPGAALLVMVAMIAANLWISSHEDLRPLGTFVSWVIWGEGKEWAGLYPGSPAWHDAYLLVLCAMAACGAFVRAARHPWRVLGLGAVLTALLVVPALAQLP